MSSDGSWIEKRLREARKAYPAVTDKVESELRSLLEGDGATRALRSSELSKEAERLLAEMIPPNMTPEADENKRD